MAVQLADIGMAESEASARVLEVAHLDEDRIAVIVKIAEEGRIFFFRRKPNNAGWYVVSVAEALTDRAWKVPDTIMKAHHGAFLCDDDEEQDALLDRLCVVIEGSLVEAQYA